ncbi:MAG TPA: hypothetical protein VK427_02455, partial [Kofleriaceae bacterium]|nr:hypothetical protein [Kofleriaceae bacterium]
MRRALRWVKRIVLGTIALVVVSVVAVLVILHTDWGREKARAVALEQLQQFFPGGIHADRIEGSVLGELRLVGVTINGADKRPMIRAKHVRANIKLAALFTKTVALEYAIANDVEITDPSNPVHIPEDPEPSTWTVEMPRLEVHRARVMLTGAQPNTFENLEIKASLVVPPVEAILARAAIVGAWKERGLPFTVNVDAKIGERAELPVLRATLGDTTITGMGIVIDPAQPVATLAIHATPAVVAAFAPTVRLPAAADVALAITAVGKESRVELAGTMGTTSIEGALVGTISTQRVRGMIAVNGVDVATFAPHLTGGGSGVFAIVADGKAQAGHVLALVRGQLLDLPAGHAMIDLSGSARGGRAFVVAGGEGGAGAALLGSVTRDGDRVELVGTRLVATSRNAAVATAGRVPVKGAITIRGRAEGTLAPTLALDVDGNVDGYGLATTDPALGGIAIAEVHGRADARLTPAGTMTQLHVTAERVVRGGSPLGTFEITGTHRGDKLSTRVVAHPAALPGAVAKLDA